jgi:hypothetical protein
MLPTAVRAGPSRCHTDQITGADQVVPDSRVGPTMRL